MDKKPRPNVWNNEHCPKYDPKVEGYGSVADWTKTFRKRMGLDEAKGILGGDDPLTVVGVSAGYTEAELKRVYRKLAMKWHPDRPGGDAKQFDRVTAAYTILLDNL